MTYKCHTDDTRTSHNIAIKSHDPSTGCTFKSVNVLKCISNHRSIVTLECTHYDNRYISNDTSIKTVDSIHNASDISLQICCFCLGESRANICA